MPDKRSQKMVGSSRYIVVTEGPCVRIYFVYKKSLELILSRACNAVPLTEIHQGYILDK